MAKKFTPSFTRQQRLAKRARDKEEKLSALIQAKLLDITTERITSFDHATRRDQLNPPNELLLTATLVSHCGADAVLDRLLGEIFGSATTVPRKLPTCPKQSI